MWDAIKHAIENNSRTARFVVILIVLVGAAWLLWR
jgi:hypothetical protein